MCHLGRTENLQVPRAYPPFDKALKSQVTGWENAKKREKNKAIEGYVLGKQVFSSILSNEEEQSIPLEEDFKVKASSSKTSKINLQWSQAMEELKRYFENQIREVEKKLGREMRVMQENHEKQVNSLLKEIQKSAEDNNVFKNRLTQMAKEVQKANEEKNALKTELAKWKRKFKSSLKKIF